MKTKVKVATADAHERLLDAAVRVFARSGLEGATTREIAREAAVNEVTLFRHFKSKDKLLGAVLQRTFSGTEEKLAHGGNDRTQLVAGASAAVNLRAALRHYIKSYEDLLQRNILLLRTLIGEIHRHEKHETRVLKGIFAPLKVDLMAAIHAARAQGMVRAEVDPLIAADLLGSMIFTDVLRRTTLLAPDYQAERYLETVLEVFVRGIESGRPRKVAQKP